MIYPREAQLPAQVAAHYDELDQWYLELWGEHVHHGLWETGHESRIEATEKLVHLIARETAVAAGCRVCDIGCGYGATARLLARRYGARVVGFTLSQAQFEYATRNMAAIETMSFHLGDWLENTLDDESFDVVISIESSEHFEDKPALFAEAFRVLKPGGRLGVFAWLAKETARAWEVKHLLEPICTEGRLPGLGSKTDYDALIQSAGFHPPAYIDLSRHVRKTWRICAARMLHRLLTDDEAVDFLLRGPRNRVFARTLFRIWAAYHTGSMRYGLFCAQRPSR